jgi:O-acetyl-ADP-ribose deacetylase (regulator of RNase III)
MIAQVFTRKHGPPIRYHSLRKALAEVATQSKIRQASVHMPRIGTGLAGGKWENIEPIIREELIGKGVSVYIYDLN